jgi:hypothetical protein
MRASSSLYSTASPQPAVSLGRVVFVASLLATALGFHAAPAQAQQSDEVRFVFIVPSGFETEFIAFWNTYENDLDLAFSFNKVLYGVEPPLPVYIRVYASRDDLFNLNLLVPPVPADGHSTHLGAREISLIAPWEPGFLVSPEGLETVRFELNNVFLSALSANNLSAGVELGISHYVSRDETAKAAAAEQLAAAQVAGTLYSWRALLDSPEIYADVTVGRPQAFAVIAFLADRYGFPSIIQLAQTLAQGEDIDAALTTVFGQPMDRLEQAWLAYLPGFIESRWQYNALYGFDLAPFEAALEAGAYAQVARGLASAVPFLELSGQYAAAEQARALIARAEAGSAAGNLVLQTRAALEGGLYDRTLELAAEARAAYAELGDDRRLDEIAAYEARAQRVLDLRTQLDQAFGLYEAGQTAAAESQLLALVPQLDAVGDADNAARAEALIALIYQQQQAGVAERASLAQRFMVVFLGVVFVVLVHQIARLIVRRWRKPEPGVL